MAKWRPEGWDKIKSGLYDPYERCRPGELVEDTADALLEALRKRGVHQARLNPYVGRNWTFSEPGTQVLIPDDVEEALQEGQ